MSSQHQTKQLRPFCTVHNCNSLQMHTGIPASYVLARLLVVNTPFSSSYSLTRHLLLWVQGIYDPKSKLVFRALAVKERRLDDALIASRLQRALQLRQRLFKGSQTTGELACLVAE